MLSGFLVSAFIPFSEFSIEDASTPKSRFSIPPKSIDHIQSRLCSNLDVDFCTSTFSHKRRVLTSIKVDST